MTALTASYQAQMAKATASTAAFGSVSLAAAQKNAAAFKTIGFASLAFGGALGFALKSAADAAISFESTFAGVRKTVEATEPEFEVMAQGIRDMAKEIPVTVEELNRIAESAGQLGIEKEGILEFTRVVADLGATTTLTSEEAANALARIANIMGTASGDFDRLGSTIVALGNAGAATEPEIVDFGLRIAGAGKIAGMTESDVLSLASSFLDVGIPAEAGGTAVQKAILGMTTAVATGGEKLEKFAETAGMSASAFAAAWRADPADAFLSFIEGLGQQGQQGIVTLQELFGVNERVARSFLSVAASGDMARTSVELGSRAWMENVALVEEAEKRYDTTASKITIAGNKMNDAAISFGEVMLPAIAAVVGILGDMADVFAALPGPVRTVVAAVALAATGMALLAGATLLLLPRLELVRMEMAKAGIQGGIFSSSLKRVAGAINPATIALTAGTLILGAWAAGKAEAKQRTEEFTSAIAADTGALGSNTSAMLVNQLSAEGLLATWKEMGRDTEAVTADVLAMADGNKEAEARTIALLESMDGSDALAFAGIIDGLKNGMADYELETEAAGDATDEAGGAAGGAAPKFDDLGNEMEDATTKAEDLKNALDELAGTELDVEKANLAWLDSVAAMNRELTHETNKQGELTNTLKDGVEQLNEHTEAGREARGVILDQIDAAIEHGAAIADETGSLKKGAGAVAAHIVQIEKQATQAGISEEAIRDYIAQLNLTPKKVTTLIQAMGVEQATNQVNTFAQAVHNLPTSATFSLGLEGGGGVQHAGGFVGSPHARRLHAGGNIRGDEEMFIGQRGERVLSVREWNALRSITGSGASAPHASRAPSGDRVVKVFVRADRRHFTDELDHDVTYAGRWAS